MISTHKPAVQIQSRVLYPLPLGRDMLQNSEFYGLLKDSAGNSLAVHWLGLCAFTARGLGSMDPWLGI